jgi:hypothetical protein
MSVIRWLFGRSKFSRFDLIALIGTVSVATQFGWPLWVTFLLCGGFGVVSALLEIVIFGDGYHKLSDSTQRIIEGRE